MDLSFLFRYINHIVFTTNEVWVGLRWYWIHWVGLIMPLAYFEMGNTCMRLREIHVGTTRYNLHLRGPFSLFLRHHPPYFSYFIRKSIICSFSPSKANNTIEANKLTRLGIFFIKSIYDPKLMGKLPKLHIWCLFRP